MKIYKLCKDEMHKISPVFEDWDETLIWSCLQGYMGNAWTMDINSPKTAQIITGDFCFFAGIPDMDLVKNIPTDFPSECILMVPQNEEWAKLIEQEYKDQAVSFMRYAIKKEPEVFDVIKLKENIAKLSPEYSIKQIDKAFYNQTRSQEWSKDLCSQFCQYSDFEERGLGFVALHEDNIVSGASSYTVYDKGIEIEIDTKVEYRRKGLAIACASALILECINRGLYPSWDAANKESVALAEKLGYHYDKEYITYAVTGFKQPKD